MVKTYFESSNSLIFIEKNQWGSELLNLESSPKVVLLNHSVEEESSFNCIEPMIIRLIELGCEYFVCAGRYSEQLHDFIDDVVLSTSLLEHQENSDKVITTTWHDTDTDDEVASFFLHSTNFTNSMFVAFLDEEKVDDRRLKKAILKIKEN